MNSIPSEEIKREDNNKIIIGNSETGFIVSQTVEANLLYAVLKQLNILIERVA